MNINNYGGEIMIFDKFKDFVLDTFFEEVEYDENDEEVIYDEEEDTEEE